ncbi:MAG: hypothetical protein RLP02_00085 [Coleofasciculus sp. C2-GNP5-27]
MILKFTLIRENVNLGYLCGSGGDRSISTHRFGTLLTITFLAVGAILTTTTSFVFAVAWLMPILGAAVPYPIFLFHVRQGRYSHAFGWVLLWAVFQSIAVAGATAIAPERAAEVVLSGTTYTEEMFHWIQTGEGAEGSPRLFLPIHLRHYIAFCVLSLITFGSAALLLGTWLLNYMNFYVAQLITISANPWLAAAIAWPPWSLLRVMGYISTGIALTTLGLHGIAKIRGKIPRHPFPKTYLLLGIGLVVADAIVKAFLAPFWQQLLLQNFGVTS